LLTLHLLPDSPHTADRWRLERVKGDGLPPRIVRRSREGEVALKLEPASTPWQTRQLKRMQVQVFCDGGEGNARFEDGVLRESRVKLRMRQRTRARVPSARPVSSNRDSECAYDVSLLVDRVTD
jgi:hypothetical protein